MSQERPSAIRSTDIVLIGAVWSMLGVIAACLPLRTWDYWYHLCVGKLLAAHQAIPATNVFGWSMPRDTEVLIHTWIADLWMLQLHEHGGLVTALLVRNLCGLAVWAALAWCIYRISERHALITTGIVGVGGITFFAVAGFATPQMFVWPLFGILAMLHVAALRWEKLWPLLPVSALSAFFWVNTAPNFWVPAGLSLAFATVAQFDKDDRRRNWFLMAAAAGLLGTLGSPHGPGVYLSFVSGQGLEAWLLLGGALAITRLTVRAPRFTRTMSPVAALGVTGLCVAVAIALQPWSDHHRAIPSFVFGDAVRQQDPLRGYAPSNVPVEATQLMASWGSQPRIYAAPHLSGYLLYELQDASAPEPIVWLVPDVAPPTEVVETQKAFEADREVMRGVFHQNAVKAVLVTPPQLSEVAKHVEAAPDWEEIGSWPSGTLWVPERRP